MNKTPIKNFIKDLQASGVPHSVDEYDDAITVRLEGTPFAVELRAARKDPVVCIPEYIMVWGDISDSHYGSVPNTDEAIHKAYQEYLDRIA